jgi:hypothetical protein
MMVVRLAQKQGDVQMAKRYEINGLELKAVKNFYTGLWEIKYVDGGYVWAGPYKTKREALERLERAIL